MVNGIWIGEDGKEADLPMHFNGNHGNPQGIMQTPDQVMEDKIKAAMEQPGTRPVYAGNHVGSASIGYVLEEQ